MFLKILNGVPVSLSFLTMAVEWSSSSTTPVAEIRKSGCKGRMVKAQLIQLISGVFEHSVLRVREIYALESVVFTLQSMDHTNHKFPIYATWNIQMHLYHH